MARHARQNWIDGTWREARGGATYDAGRFGVASRSSGEDVEAALDALQRAGRDWAREDPEDRADSLGELLDLWEDRGGPEEELAELLDLDPRGLASSRGEALALADELIDEARDAPGGPRLARVSVRALGRGLVEALVPPLLEGRGVLLLPDPEAPALARAFCRLLEDSPLPRGIVALLGDDTSEAARAALESGRLGDALFIEPRARTRRLVERLERAGTRGPRPRIRALTSGVRAVLSDEDPRRAADEVLREAFDPDRALCGQRDGALGRVVCHERRFSAFSEALLEGLDARAEGRCPLLDTGLPRAVSELTRLGLDEGATLVRGPQTASPGSPRARRDAILAPSVFTNVEPRMGLARAELAAPVLRLLRAASDEEARALARDLAEVPAAPETR